MKKWMLIALIVFTNNLLFSQFEFGELFLEMEKFEERSTVIQLGIGLRSDIDLVNEVNDNYQLEVETLLPALSVTIDKNIWNNLGLGLTIGARLWKVPKFNYQYRYFSGGLRVAYHFNIIEQLDSYVGMGVTFRYLTLANTQKNIHNTKINGNIIIGARYYFSEKFGGFLELGNDALTWFKGGLCYYIN